MTRAVLAVMLAFTASVAAQPPAPVDALFERFFAAEGPAEAIVEADRIVAAGVDFDTAYARLRTGRVYRDEQRGEFSLRWRSASGPSFNNLVDVPADYDPATRWQLRVQLHGGVGRPSPDAGSTGRRAGARAANRIAGERQIYLHPSGWSAAQWWDAEQVDNILRAVDVLKRTYNIDESRIYVTGISDGGTGVYYLALKEPNPWSSYLPLNGSLAVIRNPSVGADGEMHGNNLAHAPLYVVNGERDPLYPVAQVEPHMQWLTAMGAPLVFRPQAGAGHNTAWWPTEREPFERFVHEHPRVPHPQEVSWETERVDRFNRNRWLRIDVLRQDPSRETPLKDLGFFQHTKRSGRVDVTRNGNTFDATARDVGAFTLLLSPDAIDVSRPVRVSVNGRVMFDGMVERDVATLLRWAARDNDRTALYAAELRISL